MKLILAIVCLTTAALALGQGSIDKEREMIVLEGKELYKSEMASWYGTDIFLRVLPHRREMIGGYFSYTENDTSKCIFFSEGEDPNVIGMISFDSTFNAHTAPLDSSVRAFKTLEMQLFAIRQRAVEELEVDTLFKHYSNTNFNVIPLIGNEEKKVYVLTGPHASGVVIFGNDYLLVFDRNHVLKSKVALHRNIIVTEYDNIEVANQEVLGAMHTHLPSTGDLITPSDVCTLMLYGKFTSWEQYFVISDKYVSIWNCKTDQLEVITKDAWDKIYDDQKKRDKNRKE